ncbi:MAG: hypothetical protein ACK4UU_03040 [Fimbriimonadales bacterium]
MIPVGLFSIRQAEATDLERIVQLDQLFGSVGRHPDNIEAWVGPQTQGVCVGE